MLKTILMAVVGFVLLWLALVAEVASGECIKSIPAWGGIQGTGPPTDTAPVCTPDWGPDRWTLTRARLPGVCDPGAVKPLRTDTSMLTDEMLDETMATVGRYFPCRKDVRSYYVCEPCGPLDKAMAKERL